MRERDEHSASLGMAENGFEGIAQHAQSAYQQEAGYGFHDCPMLWVAIGQAGNGRSEQ